MRSDNLLKTYTEHIYVYACVSSEILNFVDIKDVSDERYILNVPTGLFGELTSKSTERVYRVCVKICVHVIIIMYIILISH